MKAKKLHKKWIILLYYDDTDSHTYIHKHTNSPIERGQERTKRGKMKYKMRPSQVWRTPSSRWKAMMCKLFNGIFRSIFKWLTHTQTYEKNISHCVWKTENAADLSDLCVLVVSAGLFLFTVIIPCITVIVITITVTIITVIVITRKGTKLRSSVLPKRQQ